MVPENTALLLIGFQNDFFDDEGVLRMFVEDSQKTNRIINNTIDLINVFDDFLIISNPLTLPIQFSEDIEPIGMLKTIHDVGALKEGSHGAKIIDQFDQFKDQFIEIPRKQILNAFSRSHLDFVLKESNISNIIFAGAESTTSIHSTARAARDIGYNVTILSDCILGRTKVEQKFYFKDVFPLYAEVTSSKKLINKISQLLDFHE